MPYKIDVIVSKACLLALTASFMSIDQRLNEICAYLLFGSIKIGCPGQMVLKIKNLSNNFLEALSDDNLW